MNFEILHGVSRTSSRYHDSGKPKHFLDDFASAWKWHDTDAILSIMTGDCIFEASLGPDVKGAVYRGRDAVRRGIEEVFAAFPDARWNDPRHFIAGDRGDSEWVFTATTQDGARVKVQGCDVFTFRDGKIAVKNSYRKQRTG
jgi:ketosteroid isomerase-like protein